MSTKKHVAPEELLAGLLADYKKPEDLIGENGLLKQLTKLLVEKALDAALVIPPFLGHLQFPEGLLWYRKCSKEQKSKDCEEYEIAESVARITLRRQHPING
jgi:hypothetical protein